MFTDTGIFIIFSFLMFLWVLVQKGKVFLMTALDQKIERIRTEFETLKKEKEESSWRLEKLLQSVAETDQMLENMLEDAEKKIQLIQDHSHDVLLKSINARQEAAQERMNNIKKAFESLILIDISEKIIEHVSAVLRQDMFTEKQQKSLLESLKKQTIN
jgi:F0F1-type ATP synthase membrane subunit b/b'